MYENDQCVECEPKLRTKKKLICCYRFTFTIMLLLIVGLSLGMIYYYETLVFVGGVIVSE